MDRSKFRHPLAVSVLDELRQDIFVRSEHGNVEHYWTDDSDVHVFGPEDLGGSFDTDPDLAGGHLIGRSGNRLVDWTSAAPGEAQLFGKPREVLLPGLCATRPTAIRTAGRVDVFAPSLDGPMRHWFLLSGDSEWQGPEVLTNDLADVFSRPCVVSRFPGSFDVFSVDAQNAGLRHWFIDEGGDWRSERLTRTAAGEGLVGQPTALWSSDERLDVFAMRSDGVPIHWGFDGLNWFRDEVRLKDVRLVVPADLTLVSVRPNQLTLLARESSGDGDGVLRGWTLDSAPPFQWREGGFDGAPFPAAVWVRDSAAQGPGDEAPTAEGLMTTLSRAADGGFLRMTLRLTDEQTIDGTTAWARESETGLRLEEPGPPPEAFVPAEVDPDLLARRPEDLVLLGVRWNEAFEVVAGSPTELLALAGAELAVTLPPQHYAEGINPSAAMSTGGGPVSPVRASGPSRVVVSLDAGTRVALTVDGVLAALHGGRLAASADLTDSRTHLELPSRLWLTPFRPDGGVIRLDHPSEVVVGDSGSVGLWSTTVAAEGSAPPAGLAMRPLGVDSTDDFPTALSGASRARIFAEELAAQQPTARIDDLRLSSLGGWLKASAVYPTFEWDHVAAMGRDVRVRTAMKGVLYPWGNRAVYVEITERRLDPTAAGATASLHKTFILTVTEPAHDLMPSRSFPFTRASLLRTVVHLSAEPVFTSEEFDAPAADAVRATRAFLVSVANGLVTAVHGSDGFTPGEEVVEDLAFFDFGDAATAEAAARYVDAGMAIMRADDTLLALTFGGTASVPIFFVPGGQASPILFPAVLSGPSGEVHVELPVVFFADVRMPEGLIHPAYRSLEDADQLTAVAATWENLGDGDTAVDPVRLDMVGAAQRQPADAPEVRRLHIVGERSADGFAPRLGHAPVAGELRPGERQWAFDMALTEVATLVGQPASSGPPLLRVALSPDLLSGAPDPGLLFVTPQGVDPLLAEFSRNSARSGGLAAPDLTIDGIARSKGPVQADTFLDELAGSGLDPSTFLGQDANLMGFKLASLLKGGSATKAPEILSDPRPGQPATVTMRWTDVPLNATSGRLITSAASRLTLEVNLAADSQSVTCTIHEISLAFPEREGEGDRLLEVHFGKVVFNQQGGAVPQLSVDGVSTQFFGFLKLLDELKNAIKLEGAAIEASDSGVTATYDLPIPDLTTGGFQLTGLTFHSMIDVPFDRRPVSIELAFASREDPFNLSILGLGGGGYVDIAFDGDGLKRLEVALEFGASLEVDFVVARGEVFAMGGIRVLHENGLSLTGYLRFGGMVEVLGLISVSIELLVTLAYVEESLDPPLRNAMIGRATLVLEIDLLLFSESVELDTGPWVIAGETPAMDRGGLPPDSLTGIDPEAWRSYRSVFDEAALS